VIVYLEAAAFERNRCCRIEASWAEGMNSEWWLAVEAECGEASQYEQASREMNDASACFLE
jgi:hypothetical protein